MSFLHAAVQRLTRMTLVTGNRPLLPPVLTAGAAFAVLVIAGCGSTSTTSVGPSPVKCEVSLSAPPQVGPGGGTTTILLTTQPECAWTATSGATWITRLTPRTGQGSGKIDADIAVNPVPTGREGDIDVNGSKVQVRQDFAPCSFDVSPKALSMPASGAGLSQTTTVTAIDGCTWSATSGSAFLSVSAGATGSGGGTVTVTATANTGVARSGSVTVAGQTISVSQSAAGASCSYALAPTSVAASAAGGPESAAITAGVGCAWSANSDVPWLSVTAGAAGSGNGTVAYTVATNTQTSPRTGHITVQGQTLTVSQSAGSQSCDYSLQPTSRNVAANGGPVAASVVANAGCVWTAVSNASWLTIASGGTGNGNGSVNIDVAANNTPARTGTLTIAGRDFSVVQAGGCTFTLQPTSLTIGAEGGQSSTSVTTGTGCGWTASSQASFVTINSGGSGNGGGTVSFTVAANSGPPRNGTLTIAGQTFTINQVTGCALSISPLSQNLGAGGGPGSIAVTAGTGCQWTAASNSPFISISAGTSGSGAGQVDFAVAGNSGPARSGTMTVAGQTFTVNQDSGCTYAITSNAGSVAAGGGGASTTVVTGDGCTWTASVSAQSPWITLTSSGAGSGDGNVTFSAAANSGPQRTGTLTIAGRTYTLTQASGCSYSVSPLSATVPAAGGDRAAGVTTSPGCAWTAVSNDTSFISVIQGASSVGAAQAVFRVAANTGAARQGTLTVAGQTYTISQEVGCSYTLSATSLTAASGGGNTSVNVTAPAGCAWTAASNSPFLTVTGGAAGSGSGTVSYFVAANTGPSRSGTMTVAGQTFTVNQLSGCTYSINPMSANVAVGASTGSIAVTTTAGCTWTSVSNAAFITVTSGANGNGSGNSGYSIAANTGPQRSGTITIAGQTFTVTQASGCSYSINPTSQTVGAGATNGSTNVTTTAGCTWTAVSNAAFITVTGGSGNGSGNSTFSIAANTGPQRTGTLTIAGQTFTVTQNTGCTYSINPTSRAFGIVGGAGTVTVTTGTGCTWTATVATGSTFITIVSGQTGNGGGTVNYTVLPSVIGSRSGTLTIAGQTHTVTQN